MEGNDIKNMKVFLNIDIKPSMGYCIKVSDDQKSAEIFFAVTEKIYSVRIEKLSDTKYVMIYGEKKRYFDLIKIENKISSNKFSLIIFFEDSHKFNSSVKSPQLRDGSNYFDYCTGSLREDCTVEGCIRDIKGQDDIGKAEAEGSLGIEEIDNSRK